MDRASDTVRQEKSFLPQLREDSACGSVGTDRLDRKSENPQGSLQLGFLCPGSSNASRSLLVSEGSRWPLARPRDMFWLPQDVSLMSPSNRQFRPSAYVVASIP